jgi:hypothetical protein
MKTSHVWLAAGAVSVAVAAARWGLIVGMMLAWLEMFIFVNAWHFSRKRDARQAIRAALRSAGYDVVEMRGRYWRTGPFSLWNTSRLHFVFHVLARRAAGAERTVWARWGRRWFTSPDTLELSWEGHCRDHFPSRR